VSARLAAAGLAAWVALAAGPVRAHPLGFGVLRLVESPDGRVEARFRYSGSEADPRGVRVRLPARCAPVGEPVGQALAYGQTIRWRVDCGEEGLAGATVVFEGMDDRDLQAIVHLERPGQAPRSARVTGADPTFTVPSAAPARSPWREYTRLGVEHILEGVDHLLFVLGLVLLVGLRWRLLATLTAFTLGHSVTLALSTLGWVRVSPAPVEAAIALSILLLGVELARERPAPTLTRRYPGLVAALFGLLHGLGFAGALREVGLPEGAIPEALLGFNLGVELGQILFVLAVAGAVTLARRLRLPGRARARLLATYGLGTFGAFFLLQRLASFA
jgi:hydrogenase/urease accessory protein HupE